MCRCYSARSDTRLTEDREAHDSVRTCSAEACVCSASTRSRSYSTHSSRFCCFQLLHCWLELRFDHSRPARLLMKLLTQIRPGSILSRNVHVHVVVAIE